MTTNTVALPRWLATVCTLAVSIAALMLAPVAYASEPMGDFTIFKQCPRFTAGVEECLYAETIGGSVTLNKQTVPIDEDGKHPIILQGGFTVAEETEDETFVGALNGETLSKTPQNVPGGLAGLINCTEIKGSGLLEVLAREACKAVFESKTTGVSAVTELAKPASDIKISTHDLEVREGVTLGLPVKVHLENPLLGSECYIGSSAHPINLELTDGTTSPNSPNAPISGKGGKVIFKDDFGLTEIVENQLVNNEFAAPEATGCGGILSSILDPIINSKIGLPAVDGLNTAIQDNTVRQAATFTVIESE